MESAYVIDADFLTPNGERVSGERERDGGGRDGHAPKEAYEGALSGGGGGGGGNSDARVFGTVALDNKVPSRITSPQP